MKEVPVFIINGFLESGKSTLIQETLYDKEFMNGGKTLIVLCEEGEVEYDPEEMRKIQTEILVPETQEQLNAEFLEHCRKVNNPDRVLIEFNGTWQLGSFLQTPMPGGWETVQILTLVDAQTFNNYWNNMRSVMGEQLRYSDTVIVNRCTAATDKGMIRRAVKPLNRKASIMYEPLPGEELGAEDEMPPFDISGTPIVIEDDDFGIWYMDALEHPDHYKGKLVCFKGMVYRDRSCKKGSFIPGRMAMACCANDMSFIGFLCHVNAAFESLVQFVPKQKKWVKVTAEVQYEYRQEYRAEGPVLTAKEIEPAAAPEAEVVYFS